MEQHGTNTMREPIPTWATIAKYITYWYSKELLSAKPQMDAAYAPLLFNYSVSAGGTAVHQKLNDSSCTHININLPTLLVKVITATYDALFPCVCPNTHTDPISGTCV